MQPKKNEKKSPISIFVSSTYNDLALYRTEVEKQLVNLEQAVKGMEYFGSSSATPLEVCRNKIAESQLMVLLIGVSYGSIEPSTGKSYTELEYDYAVSINIPVLVYEADLSSSVLAIPFDAIDYDNKERLDLFKERINKSHLVSFFSSIEDLGKRILHDIPAELEKLSIIETLKPIPHGKDISDDALRKGGETFERFWLRPQRFAGKIIPVRLRINKKLSGWKVKDELIRAIGLTVGDCISTEVSIQLGPNLIDDDGDTDLFADGEGADWLLDQVTNAKVVEGCIIDCFVRLMYSRAPVGINSKIINKASLVFVDGIKYVGVDHNYYLTNTEEEKPELDFEKLLSFIQS